MTNYTVTITNQKIEFSIESGYIKLNNKFVDADIVKISADEYSIITNGLSFHCYFAKDGDQDVIIYHGMYYPIKAYGLREKLLETLNSRSDQQSKEITIKAPMPGMITKLLKSEQEILHDSEGILVVEAMKMENEIRSPKAGALKKLFVKEKQAVEKGDPLFTIELQ